MDVRDKDLKQASGARFLFTSTLRVVRVQVLYINRFERSLSVLL